LLHHSTIAVLYCWLLLLYLLYCFIAIAGPLFASCFIAIAIALLLLLYCWPLLAAAPAEQPPVTAAPVT
jgi:hypothetical protein